MSFPHRSRLAVLVCVAFAAFTASAGAATKPAKTQVTIDIGPGGLYGYVSSPQGKGCAGKRKVVVYRQRGTKPSPRGDQRAGSDRSERWDEGHRWSVKESRPGRFYAVAKARRGCAAGRSETVRTPAVGAGIGGRTDFPICGPYVSEGTTEVCRLDQLHLHLEWDVECQFFNRPDSFCRGATTAGLFPWGETGEAKRPDINLYWEPFGAKRLITFMAFRGPKVGAGIGTLVGTVPSAGSPRFSIESAFAQNDQGYPHGDTFYTPDLPGQEQGDPGGPLAINFQAGSGGRGGEVDIWGYLYLKR